MTSTEADRHFYRRVMTAGVSVVGVCRGRRPRSHPELAQNAADVGGHRLLTDEQADRDLLVGHAGSQQTEYLDLPGGQSLVDTNRGADGLVDDRWQIDKGANRRNSERAATSSSAAPCSLPDARCAVAIRTRARAAS